MQPRLKLVSIFAGIVLLSLSFFMLGRQSAMPIQELDQVWASVGGRDIRGRDVWPALEASVLENERNLFRMKKRAIDDYILSVEPKKSPTTSETAETDDSIKNSNDFQSFLKDRGIAFKGMTATQRRDVISNYRVFRSALVTRDAREQELNSRKVSWSIPVRWADGPKPSLFRSKPKWTVYFNFHCSNCSTMGRIILETLNRSQKFETEFRFALPVDEGGKLRENENSIVYQTGLAYLCAAKEGKGSELFAELMRKAPLQITDLEISYSNLKVPSDLKSCLESKTSQKEIRRNSEAAASRSLRIGETLLINDQPVDVRESPEWLESLSNN